MYLRCAIHNDPKQWKSWLSQAEFWYNSAHHSSLGCSPFYALYGYEPNVGVIPASVQSTTSSVSELIQKVQTQAASLKEHLARAQNKMKLTADRKRTDQEFQVGESVLLKLQPYAQSSLVNCPFPKLAFKYFGPYKVHARIGKVAYRLELPADSLVHPVFHVSQLKPFLPSYTPVYSQLPVSATLDRVDLAPEEILDRRLVRKGRKQVIQVLVRWSTLPREASTWEDWYVLKQKFPEVVAGGPAMSGAGEDVMTNEVHK